MMGLHLIPIKSYKTSISLNYIIGILPKVYDPIGKTASFFQTWLFFGSLGKIFSLQGHVNFSQFIKLNYHGSRACTRKLNHLITNWTGETETLTKKLVEDCRTALKKAGGVQNALDSMYHTLWKGRSRGFNSLAVTRMAAAE